MSSRHRGLWLTLTLLAALSLGSGACSDDADEQRDGDDAGATDGDDAGATDGDDAGATDGDDGDDILFEPNPACAGDQGGPDGDWDCDGVLNATEQTHGTDPFDADSDDDGLCDGPIDGLGSGCDPGEDLNGNGVVDNGESDPRDPNDPPPGSPSSLVCNAARAADIDFDSATAARANLVPADGLALGPALTSGAHTFAAPTLGVFGYIHSEPAGAPTDTPLKASLQLRLRITGADIVPAVVSEENFFAWRQRAAGPVDEARDDLKMARVDRWALSFAAPTDPAAARDAVLGAISAQAVSGPDVAPSTCTNIVMHQMVELTDDGQLLTIGTLTCASDYEQQEAARVLISDLMSTTQTAPTTYTPNHDTLDFFCEKIAAERSGGLVDFIFMLDNSGSVLDEQANVVIASQEFITQLNASSLDWRIGVTTTDAYCRLDDTTGMPACDLFQADYNADPSFVGCAGLRAPGFLEPDDPDLSQQLADAVQRNPSCQPVASLNVPNGTNLCGYGFERGIISTLGVVRALTSPAAAGTLCEADPAYRLRPDANRVVIFLTDEEDEDFKLDADTSTSSPLPAADPGRADATQDYIDRFTADDVDVRAHAIVGDEGVDDGGTCTAFDPLAGTGAEHGLAYIDVARGIGGSFATICTNDFVAPIEEIIKKEIEQITSYRLSGLPIASTISVAIDDQVLGRTGPTRFDYTASTNGITLHGVSLAQGQTIAVSYKRWNITIE